MHSSYNLIRCDRNSHGGGIIVYVKKCYSIFHVSIDVNYEAIYFQLQINKRKINFISCYKPPSTDSNSFISHLKFKIIYTRLN